MVEVGIHSIKKWNVIKEIACDFPKVLFFVGCHTTDYISGSGCGGSVYSIAYFLQEEEHPGRTRLLIILLPYFNFILNRSSITHWPTDFVLLCELVTRCLSSSVAVAEFHSCK